MNNLAIQVDLNTSDGAAPYAAADFAVLTRDALAASGRLNPLIRAVTVSVACVDAATMRRENARLRGIDAPTDVLSVGHYSDVADLRATEIADIFLGEVILCYNQIARYAQEDRKDPSEEFIVAFVHGVLHLAGLCHGAVMFALQRDVATRFLANRSA